LGNRPFLEYNKSVMASQVFYRKWRPQLFSEIQEHVARTLLNALATERVSHAYLFCGPRGTGKTSTARILAKAINCVTNGKGEPCNQCAMCQSITEGRSLDVIEVDAASNTGVDDIRNLREKVNYAPSEARKKVYIIDEVHMLSTSASNALLKTLEEPPPHVMFILATTEVQKLLPTILSRCQRFDFHRHTLANTVAELARVCQGEGIKAQAEALKLIARAATGSLRDALNLLQQLNTFYGNDLNLQHAQAMLGISGDRRCKELVNHIINKDTAAGITTLNDVNNDGLDLRQFHRELVEYLRLLLLVKTGSSESIEFTEEDIKELKELANKATLPQILKVVKRFGQLDFSLDNYATLPLELAIVDSILADAEVKEEPAHRVEAEPVSRQTPPRVSPPPPEQKSVRPEEKKYPVPEPSDKPAASAVKLAAQKPTSGEADPLTAGNPIVQLQSQWSKMINEAPDGMGKTPAAALLRSARPKEIMDNVLLLSFKYPMHKENMEKQENQKMAEKIVSSFMGRPCKVRCVYEHENNHLVKAALKMGARVIDTEETT
jgi:DNA polymerase III subunit gamma/tau